MHAALELQPPEDAVTGDRGDDFLETAHFAFGNAVDLDAPALRCGIAAIHAEQVAGEDGRFIATGAGAHFEDSRSVLVLVLRRQQQGDAVLQFRQLHLEICELFLGQRRQFRIAHRRHFLEFRHLLARLDQARNRVADRFDFGVFFRQTDDLGAVGCRLHPRLDHAKTVHDLVELGLGQMYQGVTLGVYEGASYAYFG